MDPGMLIPLVGTIMGCLIVLIPVTGITARIALKPIMESLARYKEIKGDEQMVALLQQRVALLEEHVHGIERSLDVLVEEAEFRRKLEAGAPAPNALPSPAERAPGI